MNFKEILLFVIVLLLGATFYQSCVEPVDAEYDLKPDIVFIDAYALTEIGLSSVTITKSVFEFQTYSLRNVLNAMLMITCESRIYTSALELMHATHAMPLGPFIVLVTSSGIHLDCFAKTQLNRLGPWPSHCPKREHLL